MSLCCFTAYGAFHDVCVAWARSECSPRTEVEGYNVWGGDRQHKRELGSYIREQRCFHPGYLVRQDLDRTMSSGKIGWSGSVSTVALKRASLRTSKLPLYHWNRRQKSTSPRLINLVKFYYEWFNQEGQEEMRQMIDLDDSLHNHLPKL